MSSVQLFMCIFRACSLFNFTLKPLRAMFRSHSTLPFLNSLSSPYELRIAYFMIFKEHALYATAISSHYELCIAIYTHFHTMFPMKICFKAIMGYVLLFLCLLQRTFTVQMIRCLLPVIYTPFKENVHYTKSLSSYNELCTVPYFAIYKIFPVANSP